MGYSITMAPITILATSVLTDEVPEPLVMFECPALDAMLDGPSGDDGLVSSFQAVTDQSVIDALEGIEVGAPLKGEFVQNVTGLFAGVLSYRLVAVTPLT